MDAAEVPQAEAAAGLELAPSIVSPSVDGAGLEAELAQDDGRSAWVVQTVCDNPGVIRDWRRRRCC